ncbi:MAG: PQQ-dependent sugar dehydrogenase [Dehalococcoidia bacterium]
MARLRDLRARPSSLSWAQKGPAVALALLVPLAAVGLGFGLTGAVGDETPTGTPLTLGANPEAPTPTAPPGPGSSPTIGTAAPSTPAREVAAERSSSGRPTAGGYRLANPIPRVTFGEMLGFGPVPGTRQQAVVLTQGGVIWRIWLDGGNAPQRFGDLRGRIIANRATEEGLLGLAFSPNYLSNKRVYVYYTAGNPRRSVIARFRVSNGRMLMSSARVILQVRQPYPNHNGGQLAFGPSGLLHIALGDGGSAGDPQNRAQNLGTLLGKILRIDVSGDGYRVPGSNPFVGRAGARGEILAFGLRNPWRFSFDRATGQLWAGDVGQNAWEEVDRIRSGGNYGWSIREGFACYNGPCNRTGLRAPRTVYSHSQGCSITGGFVYRGAALPELRGWYVYGDFCSGRIWAVNTQGSGDPVLLANTGRPISSWGQLRNGELVAVTFANRIYRLQRR